MSTATPETYPPRFADDGFNSLEGMPKNGSILDMGPHITDDTAFSAIAEGLHTCHPPENGLPTDAEHAGVERTSQGILTENEIQTKNEATAKAQLDDVLHLAKKDMTGTRQWHESLHRLITNPFLADQYAQQDSNYEDNPFSPALDLDTYYDEVHDYKPKAISDQRNLFERHSAHNTSLQNRYADEMGTTFHISERTSGLQVAESSADGKVLEVSAVEPFIKLRSMDHASPRIRAALDAIGMLGLCGIEASDCKKPKNALTLPDQDIIRLLKGDDFIGGHLTHQITQGRVPEIGHVRAIAPNQEVDLLGNAVVNAGVDPEEFCRTFNRHGVVGSAFVGMALGESTEINSSTMPRYVERVMRPRTYETAAVQGFQAMSPILDALGVRAGALAAEKFFYLSVIPGVQATRRKSLASSGQ